MAKEYFITSTGKLDHAEVDISKKKPEVPVTKKAAQPVEPKADAKVDAPEASK